ncbi:VanZ family protein [Flavobacterium gelidilacus]|uniref:VanZ family protein n=1 Tax=Flavobacterium gelidilacus TaxID=206041 RepID=UPI0006879338|nr:VanZ family protein [Flavobacterium gelidilacus]
MITILSLVSFEKNTITTIQNTDKLVHFSFYFMLTFLLLRSVKRNMRFKYLIVIALSFFYGIIIEVIQKYFTVSRSGDIYDAIANLTGIICAALLNYFILEKFSSTKV